MESKNQLRKFLKNAFQEPLSKEILKESIDFFCKDNKKFYKYYSLDSAFTLTNLINDTIYLSSPLSFNDPFDCNLGLSKEQIIEALQPEFIHKLAPGLDYKSCKSISEKLFIDNNIVGEDVSVVKYQLGEDDSFSELAEKVKKGEKISEYKLVTTIFGNPEFLTILVNALSNGCKVDPSIIESLFTNSDVFLKIFDGKTENEASAMIVKALQIMDGDYNFLEKIILLSELSGYPLSKEVKESIYNSIEEMQEKIKNYFDERLGVCCFSRSNKEVLMWGHYANKHTGICVEYDFTNADKYIPNTFLLPVIYSKKRPLVPIGKMYDLKDKLDENKTIYKLAPYLIEGFDTKSEKWKDEREWRLILLGKENMMRKIYFPCMTKIITGTKISEDNFNAIKAIGKMKKIPVEKIQLTKDTFELI